MSKYGESYKNQYGWASSALERDKPGIRDIEKEVNLSHLRPYYRLASHHIHSNPKSILHKLGLPNLDNDLLLAGPSNAGLADPGQGMVISLNQINCVLLSLRPGITEILTMKILAMWIEELCDKFIQIHEIVEERWRSQSQSI